MWSGDQRRHVTSRSKSRPGYLRLNVWTIEQYRANCSNGTDTAFHRTYSCEFKHSVYYYRSVCMILFSRSMRNISYYHQLDLFVNLKYCMSIHNKAVTLFLHSLDIVALETSYYWSACISRIPYTGRNFIYAAPWITKLSYVCQYHSKSLYGLSCQSISQSPVSRSTDDAVNNR